MHKKVLEKYQVKFHKHFFMPKQAFTLVANSEGHVLPHVKNSECQILVAAFGGRNLYPLVPKSVNSSLKNIHKIPALYFHV